MTWPNPAGQVSGIPSPGIALVTSSVPDDGDTRTKDWYDGHAWASGIFAFADGKNQESTSESVNGWYAIYLWGEATNNDRVRDLGRLMTALEIRAAHR